jgi:hypothetical protein
MTPISSDPRTFERMSPFSVTMRSLPTGAECTQNYQCATPGGGLECLAHKHPTVLPMTPLNLVMLPIKTVLAIFCAAAIGVVTLSSNTCAQSSAKPFAPMSDWPTPVGAGQFVCCRAILVDCRNKTIWALGNIRENASDQHCIRTCLRNLKC